MKSATQVGSVLLVLSALFAVACGSAEEVSETDLGEVSLAQKKSPENGGSCTIEQCSGIKDPFGTYSCCNGVCSCSRGGVSGSCDSNGENCKESCPTPPSTPSRAGMVDIDDQILDTVSDDGRPSRAFQYNPAPRELAR